MQQLLPSVSDKVIFRPTLSTIHHLDLKHFCRIVYYIKIVFLPWYLTVWMEEKALIQIPNFLLFKQWIIWIDDVYKHLSVGIWNWRLNILLFQISRCIKEENNILFQQPKCVVNYMNKCTVSVNRTVQCVQWNVPVTILTISQSVTVGLTVNTTSNMLKILVLIT